MRILITGSKGQLGSELIKNAPKKYRIFGFDLDMDITDIKAVKSKFKTVKPDVVIHCAAYTDVDRCEDNIEKAFLVNAFGTENLAVVSLNYGCEFVYISTDYIFSGNKNTPYTEYDIPEPINVYGLSKLAGERAVTGIAQKFYILRTTGIYSRYGNNFINTVLNLSKSKKELKIVNDQICTPTYSLDLARCIYSVIETKMYGIYHATNDGHCSWYEFAKEAFKILNLDILVTPVKSNTVGRRAKRPKYSVLSNFKLEKRKIFFMRCWKEALEEFLKKI